MESSDHRFQLDVAGAPRPEPGHLEAFALQSGQSRLSRYQVIMGAFCGACTGGAVFLLGYETLAPVGTIFPLTGFAAVLGGALCILLVRGPNAIRRDLWLDAESRRVSALMGLREKFSSDSVEFKEIDEEIRASS